MASRVSRPMVESPRPQHKQTSRKRPKERRVLNVVPSKNVDNDWTFDNADGAGVVRAAAKARANVDLRQPWWRIADQGATGSCVGWALADSVLRWHYVEAGMISETLMLSPRFIWMAAKETDEFTSAPTTFIEDDGTSLKAALDVARKYGIVSDALLPFASGRLYPKPAKTFYAVAAKLKIKSYFNLGVKLGPWRKWLSTQGPILARLEVDSTFANGGDGGYLDAYDPDSVDGGHAVAIVGYNDTSFIVRNSWGRSWGDEGYGYSSWTYTQAAFTEAYGITI